MYRVIIYCYFSERPLPHFKGTGTGTGRRALTIQKILDENPSAVSQQISAAFPGRFPRDSMRYPIYSLFALAKLDGSSAVVNRSRIFSTIPSCLLDNSAAERIESVRRDPMQRVVGSKSFLRI